MRDQENKVSNDEKSKFWSSLLILKMKYKNWEGVAEALDVSPQTLDNWREPMEGKPNLKGKLPHKMMMRMVNEMARKIREEIKEEFVDGDSYESDY